MRLLLSLIVYLLFTSILSAQNANGRNLASAGYQLYQKSDYEGALNKFEEAFEKGANMDSYYYTAAKCCVKLEDMDKAERYIQKAIELGYIDAQLVEKDWFWRRYKESDFYKKMITDINVEFEYYSKELKKISEIPFDQLIPFKRGGKWGYVHEETRKEIIPARYHKTYFAGDCLRMAYNRSKFIKLTKEGEVTLVHEKSIKKRYSKSIPFQNEAIAVDTSTNFKGFRVNDKGRISSVSSWYDKVEWTYGYSDPSLPKVDPVEIFGPFEKNDKWFAVVQKDDRWGVIDEEGGIHEDVKFEYEELIPLKGSCNTNMLDTMETWLYFEDTLSKKGFINLEGEVRLYDEFNVYPFHQKNNMGFLILMNDDKRGVLDLRTMEWLIKPIEKKIWGIEYTFEGDCYKVDDPILPKAFYFEIDEGNNEKYYMNSKGEILVPE